MRLLFSTFNMKSRKTSAISLVLFVSVRTQLRCFVILSADVRTAPLCARPTSEKQVRYQKEEALESCGGQAKVT
jgi:hypothetical protein